MSRPTLPPRSSVSEMSSHLSEFLHAPSGLLTPDPRSVSQVSLCPAYDTIPPQKRELLLIYIHGFMGNETSFQSFPAHLHNVLSTHINPAYFVHTKVYPKFKTRHAISVATAQFSQWLSQFEGPMTDVVLLGHSMGGLLAAEVVLLTNPDGITRKHRIMGMVAFDTPFLGMHPGVISAGLGSLFKPAPEVQRLSPEEEQRVAEQVFGPTPQRHFTIAKPKKEHKWDSTLRFITKYHDHLTQATGNYLMSHLEFGSCLGDPIGLKNRYRAVRRLEEGAWSENTQTLERVRFINYYTVSFGREKKHKGTVDPAPPPPKELHADVVTESADGHLDIPGTAADSVASSSAESSRDSNTTATTSGQALSDMDFTDAHAESSRSSFSLGNMRAALSQTSLALVKPNETAEQQQVPQVAQSSPLLMASMQHVDPQPEIDVSLGDVQLGPQSEPQPELQPEPQSEQEAKAAKKAMKEAEKRRKAYEKEVKKTNERLEKLKKKAAKSSGIPSGPPSTASVLGSPEPSYSIPPPSSTPLAVEGSLVPQSPPPAISQDLRPPPLSTPTLLPTEPAPEIASKPPKKKRERKFCITPPSPDETWQKVEMKGVDEVGAHCGLFFIGEMYAGLVGEVSRRISTWVEETMVQKEVERAWRVSNGWE